MGALIQLVSFGTLDVALVGSPEITFFRSQYRQYSNFAMESIEQVFNGTADFGKRATSIISRSADLMAGAHLETELPALVASTHFAGASQFGYVNSIGHAIIDEVTLKVGGNDIDKQYGEWLEIVSELQVNKSVETGYNEMVGKGGDDGIVGLDGNAAAARTYWTPLRFFFEKPGLAIPLIALEFNEVKITFDFQTAVKCVKTDAGVTSATALTANPAFTSCKLYVDYIFLENEERTQLIDEPQSYLITQIQQQTSDSITWTTSDSTSYSSIRLNFNLPCKELIWVGQLDTPSATNLSTGNQPFKYSEGTGSAERDLLASCVLQVNNQDRFSARPARYFRLMQPYSHHTKTPARQIYLYSFAMNPEQFQPSGSLNYSKVDNSILKVKTAGLVSGDTGVVRCYAVNLNTFNIREGVSGLGFAA